MSKCPVTQDFTSPGRSEPVLFGTEGRCEPDASSTQGALGGKRGALSSQSTFQRGMGKQNVPSSSKGHFLGPSFVIFLCLLNTLLKRTLQERGVLFRGHVEAKNNWPPFVAKESQFKFGFICPRPPKDAHIYIDIINCLLL